ncbi:MAG: translation initiation factor IF-3 [Candidatus Electrothrix sp.]
MYWYWINQEDPNIKRRGRKLPQKQEIKSKINEAIRYPEVRLIGSEGEQLGVVLTAKARQLAEDVGLDLVEVSDKAKPPVCRIMNYDKYRYELKKKQQEAKKKQTVIETKEIKFRPKTEEHDLDFKIKKIKRFLEKKNKVKVTMQFRGREIIYAQSVGLAAIKKIADNLREDCVILQEPKMEGRQLVMFVGPKA